MELGVFIPLSDDIETQFANLNKYDFHTCQLSCWTRSRMTDEFVERIKAATKKYDVRITACWCGWSGEKRWGCFSEGPHTLGIVPVQYREQRIQELLYEFDFAKKLGVEDVITHVGFMPEVPSTTEYHQMIIALGTLCRKAKENGQYFLFETGQETPITLKRAIQDIGTGNVGINLDPANLILYGKGNPVDSLDVFGEYVRGIHGKDGFYPTDPYKTGKEVRIGDGKVDYPRFIKKLKEIGYDGAITIEREIQGDEQVQDILYAKEYLEKLIAQ